MRRATLLTVSMFVLGTSTATPAAVFYLRHTGSPVPVPGGTTQFVLDENAPVAVTPVVASISVPKKTAAALPTFIAPAFAAPGTLGLDFDVVVDLSANLAINACASVSATIERVATDGTRSFLTNGIVGTSIPQGGGGGTTGFAPVTISFTRTCGGPTDDAPIAAGESIAVTVTVSNNCKANRTVFLAYDASAAPSSGSFSPVPPDPVFVRACFAKCQLAASKASGKFFAAKTKCVLKCTAGARKGYNPFSDCDPPYAGATALCVGDPVSGAEGKAVAAIVKVCTQPGRCPPCYANGDCSLAAFGLVNVEEIVLDSLLLPAAFCEDTTDKANAKCMDNTSKALTKFIANKSKCYDKCFANEIKGIAATGSCLPPATDPQTAFCITREEQRTGGAIDKMCFVPPATAPACYSGPLATSPGWVSLVEQNIVDPFMSVMYCGSPSGAFVE